MKRRRVCIRSGWWWFPWETSTYSWWAYPLIPVYGKRWFIDDIERVEGHIAKAMDPQRLYNPSGINAGWYCSARPRSDPYSWHRSKFVDLRSTGRARNKKRPAFAVARSEINLATLSLELPRQDIHSLRLWIRHWLHYYNKPVQIFRRLQAAVRPCSRCQ